MSVFVFKDPAPPEVYTLSLHDALPIFTGLLGADERGEQVVGEVPAPGGDQLLEVRRQRRTSRRDRKSTRLNSSHTVISYAVFCLKKKKNTHTAPRRCEPLRRDPERPPR